MPPNTKEYLSRHHYADPSRERWANEAKFDMKEKVSSLFQPDTLLAEQFLETFRRKDHLEPEKRLMFAVLEDAIASFQKYVLARDSGGKALFHEAEDWILEESSDWLFSFENICEVLGLNPSYVRQGLMSWKEMKLSKPKAKIYHLNDKREKEENGLLRAAVR